MIKIKTFKIVWLLFSLLSVFSILSCMPYQHIREMEIRDINIEWIKDGIYKGKFNYGIGMGFTYEVQTTVKNHKIVEIDILKNKNTRYAKMAEEVTDRIIEAQNPNVDAISGATATSKALMKAVENSLMTPPVFKKKP